jgi:hypothetical protein
MSQRRFMLRDPLMAKKQNLNATSARGGALRLSADLCPSISIVNKAVLKNNKVESRGNRRARALDLRATKR